MRSGGWAQIHLCWMVLGGGKPRSVLGILRSAASQLAAFVFCWCPLLLLVSRRQTILCLAVDLPEPVCLSVVTE